MKNQSSLLPVPLALALALGLALMAGACRPSPAEPEQPRPLHLEKGDRIAVLGNALADRMQHAGHLETLIHAAHPEHHLVFRNLAAAGDEVDTWHRSDGFGTRDEWLDRVEATVVLAFYGFVESFSDTDGLDLFRDNLSRFIEEVTYLNSGDTSPRRLVLFSPAANERHPDPDFPDPAENNRRIALYAEAMRETAEKHGVTFVDLFRLSQPLLAQAAAEGTALTVNGHYLNDEGYRRLAPSAYRAIFNTAAPEGDYAALREAVLEKNRQWHRRYRTIDAYNIHGGRSALAYLPDETGFIYDRDPPEPRVSNFQVMQREMGQRDVMTANRDQRIWALARGRDRRVIDDNLPPVPGVPTNFPGANPDGSHPILGGEEAMEKMTLHPGLQVNLFADEEGFPELINPVQIAWDMRGRLWVAVWPEYPLRRPTNETGDALLIFEDTTGDGRADRMTPFATGLNAPTGFQFYRDGVLVVQAPDLWFLRDTNGDGRADWKERVLMGLDSADSHHTSNSLAYDPGGGIYLSDGVFHRTQVETFWGTVRNTDGGIYRFEPRTGRFETHIAYPFSNPHGRVFDRWGNDLVTDATGNHTLFGPAVSGRLDPELGKHPRMRSFWDRPSRPAAGTVLLSSRHFPEKLRGNFLNLNVIGFQGIYNVRVREEGSGLKGTTEEHLLQSSDRHFIPSDAKIGPDGALYFSDWHNPIVGHMQHHLRDPNRDNRHGRIYRVTHADRALLKPPVIHGAAIGELLDLLTVPEDSVRILAKIELDNHPSPEVIREVNRWIQSLDTNHPYHEHHLMEALWVHQWHNVADLDLLNRLLSSPEPRARAAAARVLCHWRERVPDSLERFAELALDDHPRVRLEAVRAASFYRKAEAAEVALSVLTKPMDYYLDYALTQTLRQLERYWREPLLEGIPLAAEIPGAIERLLDAFATDELSRLPPVEPVLLAQINRPDTGAPARLNALRALARARGTEPVAEALPLIGKAEGEPAASIARILPMLEPNGLRTYRESLLELARQSSAADIRIPAWAALAVADGSFERLWPKAESPAAQAELIGAIPLVPGSALRNSAHAVVREIAVRTPEENQSPFTDLRRAAIRALATMTRHQAETFAILTHLMAEGDETVEAARALRDLPREQWSAAGVDAAVEKLVAWAGGVPVSERTGRDYVEIIQTAGEMAAFLPEAEAETRRRELAALRVAVYVVRAVPGQMRFDVTRLVVETGQPFELILENPDFMPHNLVIVEPGARQTIGRLADRMDPAQRDAHGRLFVPDRPEVIAATRMLEMGQSETLTVTAPEQEGVYEFVCTFPGHWSVMWGELVVTRDGRAVPESKQPSPNPTEPQPHSH